MRKKFEECKDRRTEREKVCDSWGSFCMTPDPIALWEADHSPDRVAIDAPLIGGLSTLMAPFIFLVDVGTSESLQAGIGTLRRGAEILRRHGPWFEETATRIETELRRIKHLLRAAAVAEELLQKHGWKYDDRKKTLLEIAPRRGGDFLNLIIRRLGVEYGKDQAARTRIKQELAPFFGEDRLDAGSKGNIARALENLKR